MNGDIIDLSDEELYKKYIENGDKSSFRVIFERHMESLTLYINALVKNMQDAEDIMMDAFAVAASGESRFSGKSTFKTWLFGIAHHLACKHLRRKKRIVPSDTDYGETLFVQDDTEFFAGEEKLRLYEALAELSPERRNVLYLLYFERMSHDDIARVMRKSKKQIYNLLARAKAELKCELEKSGFGSI